MSATSDAFAGVSRSATFCLRSRDEELRGRGCIIFSASLMGVMLISGVVSTGDLQSCVGHARVAFLSDIAVRQWRRGCVCGIIMRRLKEKMIPWRLRLMPESVQWNGVYYN